MNQKHKVTVIVVCFFLLIAAYGGFLFCLLEGRARKMNDDFMLKALWVELEAFRGDEGHYPESLDELLSRSHTSETEKQELAQDLKHNVWHSTFFYKPTTNGYSIIVTGPELAPAGWFGQKRKIEKNCDEVGKLFGPIQSHAK